MSDLNIASVVLAIVIGLVTSTAVGIAIYAFTRSRSELTWAIDTRRLIGNAAGQSRLRERLSVRFDGDPIEDLSSSVVVVWNSGNRTVHEADLDTGSEFHLGLQASTEGAILSSSVESVSNPASTPSVKLYDNGKHVSISFRYLDPGDEFEIHTFQTVMNDTNLQVVGKVRGTRITSQSDVALRFQQRIVAGFVLTFILGVAIPLARAFMNGENGDHWVLYTLQFAFYGLLVFLIAWVLVRMTRKR